MKHKQAQSSREKVSLKLDKPVPGLDIIIEHLIAGKPELVVTSQVFCTSQVLGLEKFIFTPIDPTTKAQRKHQPGRTKTVSRQQPTPGAVRG